jgi:hypothetical protein
MTNENERVTCKAFLEDRLSSLVHVEALEGWTQKRRLHVWSFDSAQEEGTILKNGRLLRSR